MFLLTRMIAGLPVLFLLVMATGCSKGDSATGSYDSTNVYRRMIFGELEKKSIAYEGVERNPVIVVHGFLGARLKNMRTGKNVWGDFRGIEILEGYSAEHLRDLSIPMALGKSLNELKGDVAAVSLLENFNVKFLGMQLHVDAYNRMIDILFKSGYMPEDRPLPKGKNFYSLFIFYYDWRRDLPENAAMLQKFIMEKRAYLQDEYKKLYGCNDYDVQFDIVAHSMGGLLSRYYLMYGAQNLPADGSLPKLNWDGSRYIDKLIIIGTPNSGYLDTCVELINGLKIDEAAPLYPPAVLGTFPTYYQMLPLNNTGAVRYADVPDGPGIDLFDPQVWIAMRWGLADPRQDETLKLILPTVKSSELRRKIALDHLTKCLKRARQFTDAMRVNAEPPDDVVMYLFMGDAVLTRQTALADRKTGILQVSKFSSGDGKVLTSSARMDEREGRKWVPFVRSPIKWQAVFRLRAAHMGITESPAFADNVADCLLSVPTVKQARHSRSLQNPGSEK